jgi:phosphatidylinositol alpha-mannosyltransferase
MKIGLVIDDGIDSTDGVQQYIKTLGEWLIRQGDEVVYITSTGQAENARTYNLARNVKVKFNKNVLRVPMGASVKQLRKILYKENFDVIHVQMPYSPLLSGRLIHVLPKKVALVGTFHIAPFGAMQSKFSTLLGYVLKPQLNRFQAIVSVSPAAQQFAKKSFGIKSSVVPNAVNVQRYINSAEKTTHSIVYIGRLVHRKGCMQLLIAINHLVHMHKFTNFELMIVGDGPEYGALSQYVATHNLTKQVKLLGKVSEDEKIHYLSSAELAIYPSISGESFGIVLIEAIAAGCVTLAGKNPGYAFVMQESPEALFDPFDYNALSNLIFDYLTKSQLSNRLRKRQKQLLSQFTIDTVGARIIEQYKHAIEKIQSKGHN